jgi:hypothetical protein
MNKIMQPRRNGFWRLWQLRQARVKFLWKLAEYFVREALNYIKVCVHKYVVVFVSPNHLESILMCVALRHVTQRDKI